MKGDTRQAGNRSEWGCRFLRIFLPSCFSVTRFPLPSCHRTPVLCSVFPADPPCGIFIVFIELGRREIGLTRGFLTKRFIGFSSEQSSHYWGTQSNFHSYNGWVPQFTKIYGGERRRTNPSLCLWFLRVYRQMSSTRCCLYLLFVCNSIQACLEVTFVPGCTVTCLYSLCSWGSNGLPGGSSEWFFSQSLFTVVFLRVSIKFHIF